MKVVDAFESFQRFACKICCKQWNLPYSDILVALDIPALKSRHLLLKLVLLYRMVRGFCCCPVVLIPSRVSAMHNKMSTLYHLQELIPFSIPSFLLLYASLTLPSHIVELSSFQSFQCALCALLY